MDFVGEGKGRVIWENGIETCIISCMKRVASPGSMHNAKVLYINLVPYCCIDNLQGSVRGTFSSSVGRHPLEGLTQEGPQGWGWGTDGGKIGQTVPWWGGLGNLVTEAHRESM